MKKVILVFVLLIIGIAPHIIAQTTISTPPTDFDGKTPPNIVNNLSPISDFGSGYKITAGTNGRISLNGSTSIGQSFTTARTGFLTEFEIQVVSPPTSGQVTYRVWKNGDIRPTVSFTGPGLVKNDKVGEGTISVNNAGLQTLVLPTPIPLDANTVYVVEIFGRGLFLRYEFPQSYGEGRILWSSNLFGCCDLRFTATIINSLPSEEKIIPAFSEWGVIIFGLLVLNLGIFFIYRRIAEQVQ